MYEFLRKNLPEKYANLAIQAWYIILILVNIYLANLASTEGAFRYIGW